MPKIVLQNVSVKKVILLQVQCLNRFHIKKLSPTLVDPTQQKWKQRGQLSPTVVLHEQHLLSNVESLNS